MENDEITSIEVKTVEVKSPVVPTPEEAVKAQKAHRLTAEEKEIKAALGYCAAKLERKVFQRFGRGAGKPSSE